MLILSAQAKPCLPPLSAARLHPDHVAQSFLQVRVNLQLRSVAPLLRRTQAVSQLITPPPMQTAQIVKL
jgi:hypothetical protein